MNTERDANAKVAEFDPSQADAFHGQGGSYVFDVATGTRRRLEEPAPASTPAAAQSVSIATEASQAPAAPEAKPKASVRRITPANADDS